MSAIPDAVEADPVIGPIADRPRGPRRRPTLAADREPCSGIAVGPDGRVTAGRRPELSPVLAPAAVVPAAGRCPVNLPVGIGVGAAATRGCPVVPAAGRCRPRSPGPPVARATPRRDAVGVEPEPLVAAADVPVAGGVILRDRNLVVTQPQRASSARSAPSARTASAWSIGRRRDRQLPLSRQPVPDRRRHGGRWPVPVRPARARRRRGRRDGHPAGLTACARPSADRSELSPAEVS